MPTPHRANRKTRITVLIAALLAAFVVTAPPAEAATRADVMRQAADYAQSQGYHVGIAVLDTKTGATYGSGDYTGYFASQSVVKVFIATRLLVQGEMWGTTASMAYKMITQSDDAMATALYGRVGGDSLINWVKSYFNLPGLGYPPSWAGWWGDTHIRPLALVRFYAKVKRNPVVAPWLLDAMHHATTYGSDGTYQFFGLPSATSHPAIKQGWGGGYGDWPGTAGFNTTGYVNGDRYAVAILARGPGSDYGWPISSMLTHTARLLLPGGYFPDPVPRIGRMSRHTMPIRGGWAVTVRGSAFTHVSRVMFGALRGTNLTVTSSTALTVTAPAHAAGWVDVRVVTTHGTSPVTSADWMLYVPPPSIGSVQPAVGSTSGGTKVLVSGHNFIHVRRVVIGGIVATALSVISPTQLTFVTPAHPVGLVNVRVVTAFGWSVLTLNDRYLYADPSPTA